MLAEIAGRYLHNLKKGKKVKKSKDNDAAYNSIFCKFLAINTLSTDVVTAQSILQGLAKK